MRDDQEGKRFEKSMKINCSPRVHATRDYNVIISERRKQLFIGSKSEIIIVQIFNIAMLNAKLMVFYLKHLANKC